MPCSGNCKGAEINSRFEFNDATSTDRRRTNQACAELQTPHEMILFYDAKSGSDKFFGRENTSEILRDLLGYDAARYLPPPTSTKALTT